MSKTKVKKVKAKTHKATAKRFKVSAGGMLRHIGQGGGNGHSNNYKNRRQKRSPRSMRALSSGKETRKLLRLLGQ